MKTFLTILGTALLAMLMAFSGPLKNPTGAPAEHTGSPGDGANCTACHGGSASAISDVITTNIPSSGYVAGTTYTINVNLSASGRKGFQVSPQNASGTLLGTLTAGNGNQLVGNNKYVTHSSGITEPSAQWSFSWTAPQAGTGNVVFYGAFVLGFANVRLSSLEVTENQSSSISELLLQSFKINPVHSTNLIMIDFQLSEPSRLSFEILDLSGKSVFNADLGSKPGGNHSEVVFIGPNLPNSVYIGMLRVNHEFVSKKFML